MPAKRSRIGQSSSFGETGVFNQLFPPAAESSSGLQNDSRAYPPRNAAKALKPSVEEEEEPQRFRSSLLYPPSPEIEKAEQEGRIGHFLDKCQYCKKKMSQKQEVYMYRCFQAFCTSECRDRAIEMDEAAEKLSKRPTEAPAQFSMMEIMNEVKKHQDRK